MGRQPRVEGWCRARYTSNWHSLTAANRWTSVIFMPAVAQQVVAFKPRTFWKLGIALFVLSFLVPAQWAWGPDFHMFGGCQAFVATPALALNLVNDVLTVPRYAAANHAILLALVAIAAWLANSSVFLRLPRVPAVLVSLIPWIAYSVFFSILADFIPFYFWAFGIGLIHCSRLLEPTPAELPRNAWTGF